MAPVIFSTHRLHPAAEARLSEAGRLCFASALDERTLIREGRDAAVIIVRAPIPAALFGVVPALRAAIRHGAGLDMIPLEAASRAGVLVANVPAVNARSVAEYVIFACLALLRRFRMIDRDLRGAGWPAGRAHADLAHELSGRTMGIVGFGSVGRAVAAIARDGFGLPILVHTRSPDVLRGEALEVCELDRLMAESDIVVLCCPLTAETRGLVDARRLALMKPSALLVNVARGPVVDEAALVSALEAGRLGGAALDVFSSQPLSGDHPFLSLDNVILTPHLAGITAESMLRMGMGAAEEAVRVLSGRLPVNLCNPEAVAAYRRRFPGAGAQ
jgi:D-3-phosphoglycerate dehydrogenase